MYACAVKVAYKSSFTAHIIIFYSTCMYTILTCLKEKKTELKLTEPVGRQATQKRKKKQQH
jgi:hypothetical protein